MIRDEPEADLAENAGEIDDGCDISDLGVVVAEGRHDEVYGADKDEVVGEVDAECHQEFEILSIPDEVLEGAGELESLDGGYRGGWLLRLFLDEDDDGQEEDGGNEESDLAEESYIFPGFSRAVHHEPGEPETGRDSDHVGGADVG